MNTFEIDLLSFYIIFIIVWYEDITLKIIYSTIYNLCIWRSFILKCINYNDTKLSRQNGCSSVVFTVITFICHNESYFWEYTITKTEFNK